MLKTILTVFLLAALMLPAADLRSKALLPVKWEQAASHPALKLVDNGKLNFAIVYDPATEPAKQLKVRLSGKIAALTLADAFERTTGQKPEILPPGSPKLAKYPYVIALGKTQYAAALKLDGTTMPKEGYTLSTFD